jgi:hypothetical protein
MDMQINLVCCTEKKCTQKDIALIYAMAMKSAHQKADTPDWHAINRAIIGRWSMSGLERVKKMAYDLLAGKRAL